VKQKHSITRAGHLTGVHRTTLHRWLKSERLEKDDEGLVDLDDINALKDGQQLGRKCGKAYPAYRSNQNESGSDHLNRSLNFIASAWRHSAPNVRKYIDDELTKLLKGDYYRDPLAEQPVIDGQVADGKPVEDAKPEAISQISVLEEHEPILPELTPPGATTPEGILMEPASTKLTDSELTLPEPTSSLTTVPELTVRKPSPHKRTPAIPIAIDQVPLAQMDLGL